MFQGPNITYHLLCTNTKAGSFDCPPFRLSVFYVFFFQSFSSELHIRYIDKA